MTTVAYRGGSRHLKDLPAGLPGAELIESGIASLERGEHTTEALLVALGAARLRALGLNIPRSADRLEAPNLALYAAVRDGGGDHFDYNALLRRLSSFADAAEWLLRESPRESVAARSVSSRDKQPVAVVDAAAPPRLVPGEETNQSTRCG